MAQNKDKLLCSKNSKITICQSNFRYKIKNKCYNTKNKISDIIYLNENEKLIIEQIIIKQKLKNSFAISCKYTRKGKSCKIFTLQNAIYRQFKKFIDDIYMIVLNNTEGSEIKFYKIAKKINCIFTYKSAEQIIRVDSHEAFVMIGFIDCIKLCKLLNTIVTIFTEKSYKFLKDLKFIRGIYKYQIDEITNEVIFIGYIGINAINASIGNKIIYFNDDYSIYVYDIRTNILIKRINFIDKIVSLSIGCFHFLTTKFI